MNDRNTQRIVPSEVYDKHYYLEQNGPGGWQLFLNTHGQHSSPGGKYFQSLGRLKDGMYVLDVGCGRGELVFSCVQNDQLLGVGIDYSSTAMTVSRGITHEFASEEQKIRMLFIRADASQMPFRKNSFDVIFSHHVVEHLLPEKFENMLRECNMLLRKGGRLVLETAPNLWRMRYGFRITRLLYRISFLGAIYCRIMSSEEIPKQAKTSEGARFHVGEQSVLGLKRALKRNGFECKVWVGLGQDTRFTRGSFNKRFGRMGVLLYSLYYLLYGIFPFSLVFGDIIYALAWLDRD